MEDITEETRDIVETIINRKALEDTTPKALPSLFPNLLGAARGARVEFYDKLQHTADKHDHDFVRKYEQDLDITLIFAGLFSIVTSIFIVDVQSNLQPDYTQLSYGLLQIIANVSLGHTPTGPAAALPQWTGPDPTVVKVQTILYTSLATSLLAAFVATLGKQWLNRYSEMETRGPIIDRGRRRQRKMHGMVTWHFDLVMESLPLLLQAALLLLGYALSNYLFLINKVVASVAIGFAVFALLFYLLTVSAATFSYNCPFQTPLSLILRSLIRFDGEHNIHPRRTMKWFRGFPPQKTRPRPTPSSHSGFGALNVNSSGDHTEFPMANTPNEPSPLFNGEADWDGYVLDSNCIAWLFEMSMDAAATVAIIKLIPEVVWHAGIRTAPLERLYDTVLECFDGSSGRPVVVPKLRNRAYLSAKALLHLAIQRKCIGNESDRAMLESISNQHPTMGSKNYEGDSDLESTLGIIDRVFGVPQPMPWQDFSFTAPHHAWMGHILLYRACDVIRKDEPLPDDIGGFVLHSLRLEPPPPATIVADCLLIVGLTLGIGLHADDLLVVDKSHEVNPQINRIFDKLAKIFMNPTSDGIDRALKAMELIAPFSGSGITQKSYELFHVIMQAPISLAYSEEKKWVASRLAMHSAYKQDRFLPLVEDPRDILDFLDHHFDLAIRHYENQDEPIQDALRGLAYASSPLTIEALKDFDLVNPLFVHGICYVLQNDRPSQLRKAALFFLPLIGDRWFNTPNPIMEPDKMKSFCTDWASAVDDIEHTSDVQKAALTIFFGMIDSSYWRPHIVAEKWRLLEYFGSVPDDSQPLKRCIDNPDVTDAIRNVDNPDASLLWLAILWLKYGELIPRVQEQLVGITKEVALGERSEDLDTYLLTIDSELREAGDGLTRYTTWSTDPAAIALRTKIENLQLAESTLISLKSG